MIARTERRNGWLWMYMVVGVSMCLLIAYWGARTAYPLFAFDDAFISYRYARNLRDGLGLTYNPGEWVLGTTTPLYTLVLSALGTVFSNIELTGHWLGVLSWMACIVGVLLFFWHEGSPRAGIIAALLLAPQGLYLRSLGMEPPFVVALMLMTAWAWLSRRRYLAVILAALLLLARYDTALWLVFLGLEVWRRERRLPWRETIAVVTLNLPWLVFSFVRYGAIMPNSASAKIGQNAFMQVHEITQSFVGVFAAHLTNGFSPLATLAVASALLWGLWTMLRRRRQFIWLLTWMIGYLIIYSLLQVSPFPWYMVPPLTGMILVYALGIGVLLGDAEGPVPAGAVQIERAAPPRPLMRVSRLLPGGIGVLIGSLLVISSWIGINTWIGTRGHPRWSEYYQAARWLANNAPRDATVATIEIGIIGYYSNLRIFDTMGLVSRDIAQHLTGWSDTLIYTITTHWPDYVIVLQKTAWDGIVPQWWFKEHYRPVVSFPSTIEELGPATIYALVNRPTVRYRADTQADYVTGLTLVRADFSQQVVQPGETLRVWLQFLVKRPLSADYQITASLVDTQTSEHQAVTSLWPYDIMSAYPSSRWRAGDIRSMPVRLTVPPDLPPGAYRLGVLLYDSTHNRPLGLTANPNSENPEVQVGYLRVGELPNVAPMNNAILIPVGASWEESIVLRAVRLPNQTPESGQVLPVQLEWEATGSPQRDATVFVHVVDKNGNIVAQRDQRPFENRFPTTVWRPGEVARDTCLISLPSELPSGLYHIKVGLYDSAGRLTRSDQAGRPTPQEPVSIPIKIHNPGN